MRQFRLIVGAILFITLSSFKSHAKDYQQAQQLMTYFGSSCSVNGDWTKGALAQAQSLITMLESVQNDPACKSTSGAIAELEQLKRLTYRLSYSSTETQILATERAEQELLLAYSSAHDSEKPLIMMELRATQIHLAQLTGYDTAHNANLRLSERDNSLGMLVSGTQSLLNQAIANQSCWMQQPAFLQGIGGLVGAVAASATSATLALPLKAGVELTGMIIEYARQAKIAKQIQNVSQGLQATAFQCTLESLAEQWCGANDAIHAIELKARATVSSEPQDLLWVGVKLIDKDLPKLLDWLQQVRSGVDPSSLSEAERQAEVLAREQLVKKARAIGVGVIEESRTLHQKASTTPEKWSVEKKIITKLIKELLGSPYSMPSDAPSNPLVEVYEHSYAGYYLLGIERAEYQKLKSNNGGNDVSIENFDPKTQWTGSSPYTPDLDAIKKRLLDWIVIAQDRVQDEFSLVFQIDPQQIVTDTVTEDIRGDSPKKSMQRTVNFLKIQLTAINGLPPIYRSIYTDTISRLEKILKEIEAVFDPNTPVDPIVALKSIHQLAQLENGVIFLGSRLERSIRLSLNSLVQSSTGIDQSLASQFLAAGNIISDLQRFSGNRGLEVLKMDAGNSQSITQNSLNAFADIFGKNIRRAIEEYDVQALASGESGEGPNKRAKSMLCLKLLALEVWPKEVPFQLCDGAQLSSVYPGGPKSLMVDKALLAKKFPERICAYRNFIRSSRIHGDYYKNAHSLKPTSKPRSVKQTQTSRF